MHELGIANSILEAVRAEALRCPGARPRKVTVRLGELAGVDPDALSFCFETLAGQGGLESVSLEIEPCPRRHRCPACGHEFTVVNYEFDCPACREPATECISGTELELAYLELEEP